MDALVEVIENLKNPVSLEMSSSSSGPRSVHKPVRIKPEMTIPFELLYAQLNDNGKISSTDFLAQSRLALQTSVVDDHDQTSSR